MWRQMKSADIIMCDISGDISLVIFIRPPGREWLRDHPTSKHHVLLPIYWKLSCNALIYQIMPTVQQNLGLKAVKNSSTLSKNRQHSTKRLRKTIKSTQPLEILCAAFSHSSLIIWHGLASCRVFFTVHDHVFLIFSTKNNMIILFLSIGLYLMDLTFSFSVTHSVWKLTSAWYQQETLKLE